MPLLDPEVSEKIGTLQLMDDAIAFRSGRLQRPCLDCTSRLRCDEHAFDQHLLETYQARYAAAWAAAFAGMDAGDIGKLMQAEMCRRPLPSWARPSPRACGKPRPAARSWSILTASRS